MRYKKSRNTKKPFVIFLAILIVGGAAAFWVIKSTGKEDVAKKNTDTKQAEIVKEKHPDRIRLIATGDIVAHDSVNENAKQGDGSYDYYSMVENFKPIFDASDIRFCNQVTPAGGTEFGITGYPKFNAPTELVRDMGKLGCNTVNMASNHSFDNSQGAISANVAAWQQVPNMLAAAGQNRNQAEHDKVHIFTVKGVKFAFLAYTTYINGDAPAQNNYGVNKYSRDFASKQITEAKQQGADIIIASMRWGTEYSPAINSQQNTEAQYLADQGVRVVLGHGPHVLQPVKELTGAGGKKTYVWYSLGNFLNTQIETEALFNGLGIVDFSIKNKDVTGISYLPLYMHYEWSAADKASENLRARKNLQMYVLDDATAALLASNQLDTTVEAQRQRITDILNTSAQVPIITKQQYLD